MRILVLGGDGYLGWPTALHLSQCGHEVAVADNFVRRHYDFELGVEPSATTASTVTSTSMAAEASLELAEHLASHQPATRTCGI